MINRNKKMKCHLCGKNAKQMCDKCKKPTCIYDLVKSYHNKKSKRAFAKNCFKCFDMKKIEKKLK